MRQQLEQDHRDDENGNPAGGTIKGIGIAIIWQDGPLGRGEERKAPNGAFVEGVVQAALGRLRYYQRGKFNCPENERAIAHLEAALTALEQRTKGREKRGVEGTHEA